MKRLYKSSCHLIYKNLFVFKGGRSITPLLSRNQTCSLSAESHRKSNQGLFPGTLAYLENKSFSPVLHLPLCFELVEVNSII